MFNDLNDNGKKDSNEPGLYNWTVELLNSSGNVASSTTSDTNGNYKFASVFPGTFTLAEILQTGWVQTRPAPPGTYSVTTSSGTNVTGKNFGNHYTGSSGPESIRITAGSVMTSPSSSTPVGTAAAVAIGTTDPAASEAASAGKTVASAVFGQRRDRHPQECSHARHRPRRLQRGWLERGWLGDRRRRLEPVAVDPVAGSRGGDRLDRPGARSAEEVLGCMTTPTRAARALDCLSRIRARPRHSGRHARPASHAGFVDLDRSPLVGRGYRLGTTTSSIGGELSSVPADSALPTA